MLGSSVKLNEYSEFDRLGCDSPQNLTDFSTRVTWCSSKLRTSFYENMEKMNKISRAPEYPKDMMADSVFPIHYCRTTAMNISTKSHLLSLHKSDQSSPLWRPFSAEPDKPTATKKNFDSFKADTKLPRVTFGNYFPVILPSFVKVGESTASVFRAVRRRKYQCQFCDICFLNGGQLAAHVRVHTGLKPYRCEHYGCSRSFARNEELTRHLRIHTGDKPHQCNICNKRFGRKDHLNKHRKTHLKASEKKVYLCQVSGCGHKYTRSDALTRHLTTAHFIKHVRGRK